MMVRGETSRTRVPGQVLDLVSMDDPQAAESVLTLDLFETVAV